ncbi:MAG: hypothetical protein IMW91_09000 [Firmicutes bacterium]|nr:hypothetical protein [Bacillota bacterium]
MRATHILGHQVELLLFRAGVPRITMQKVTVTNFEVRALTANQATLLLRVNGVLEAEQLNASSKAFRDIRTALGGFARFGDLLRLSLGNTLQELELHHVHLQIDSGLGVLRARVPELQVSWTG